MNRSHRHADTRVAPALGVASLLLLLGACGTDDREQTALGGAALGAAAGCGVGAVVSGEGATGCAVGGALGGAAGLAAGSLVAERKQSYADWNELLDAELDDAERVNDELSVRNERLRDEVRERQRRAEVLEAAVASGRASADDKEGELEEVRARVEAAEEALAQAREELEVKRALLDEAGDRDDVAGDDLRAYADRVAEMERHVEELDGLIERYEDVGERVDDI